MENMTVTMPLSAFRSYEKAKKELIEMKMQVPSLYDFSTFEADGRIRLDVDRAIEWTKKYIPKKYGDAIFVV